jgi:hypothetical protein
MRKLGDRGKSRHCKLWKASSSIRGRLGDYTMYIHLFPTISWLFTSQTMQKRLCMSCSMIWSAFLTGRVHQRYSKRVRCTKSLKSTISTLTELELMTKKLNPESWVKSSRNASMGGGVNPRYLAFLAVYVGREAFSNLIKEKVRL